MTQNCIFHRDKLALEIIKDGFFFELFCPSAQLLFFFFNTLEKLGYSLYTHEVIEYINIQFGKQTHFVLQYQSKKKKSLKINAICIAKTRVACCKSNVSSSS